MTREQTIEKIALDLFDVWIEAKSGCPDGEDWDDVTWGKLPEKHKEEYIKTATRIYGYRLVPELKVLKDARIKQIFLTHYAKQYGEDAAKQLLEQLPDCNYAEDIAKAQRDYDLRQLEGSKK